MLSLIETRDEKKIAEFVKGEGIRRKCMGGSSESADIGQLVASKNNHFLLVFDDGKPVGFVSFSMIKPSKYAIHVCLRTMGAKTKKIISLAFNFAAYALAAESIYAIYPASYRAIKKLTAYFKFQVDDSMRSEYQVIGVSEPYIYEKVDLI